MELHSPFSEKPLLPKDLFPGRAAEYVRMSTDDQQYSIANQHDAIMVYAINHNLTIVRTYTDAGKSGLNIVRRNGLLRLMADVQGGAIDYSTILVYDVSRWGRFQDADEAAYYEQICKRAGVIVEYCAEMFQNDQGITATIIKNIKRVMAAEYSRELSVKVFTAKCRLARLGLWQGGGSGYALRRQLISADGRRKMILKLGQRKTIRTDRIVLVPGPAREIKVVNWIYKRFVKDRRPIERIAEELEKRGIARPDRSRWTYHTVREILSSEKYIGNFVFNRFSLRLGSKYTRNRPEEWIRIEGALTPIVQKKLFDAAAKKLKQRKVGRYTIEMLLEHLRKLLKQHGKLTAPIIDAQRKSPGSMAYIRRFGSMVRAYQLVGYVPSERSMKIALIAQARRQREEAALADALKVTETLAPRSEKAIGALSATRRATSGVPMPRQARSADSSRQRSGASKPR